jgi:hypothetical protein
MVARQRQLVPDLVLLRYIAQFAGDFAQRMDDQSVNTPGDRHRHNQRQK